MEEPMESPEIADGIVTGFLVATVLRATEIALDGFEPRRRLKKIGIDYHEFYHHAEQMIEQLDAEKIAEKE